MLHLKLLMVAVLSLWMEVKSWTCFLFAADWDSALGVNLKGYAFGIKHASQAMMDQAKQAADKEAIDISSEDGRSHYAIVNIASTASFTVHSDMVQYCTAKAGVLGMTRSCALDLGKHNIRCVSFILNTNCIDNIDYMQCYWPCQKLCTGHSTL